ncbi:MAG TPA: hypothetical protein VKC59_06200, partial [Candidatus Limnocylindrales bacterium]|nr:hypothetical protein [Candidatus Limnocylindrales bacterium]
AATRTGPAAAASPAAPAAPALPAAPPPAAAPPDGVPGSTVPFTSAPERAERAERIGPGAGTLGWAARIAAVVAIVVLGG